MITTHKFDSTSDAYDAVNSDDSIKNGDVLVVESERVVGFACAAWPVAVTPERGAFHALAPDTDVSCIGKQDAVHVGTEFEMPATPGRDYSASHDVASAIADALWGDVGPDHDPINNPRIVPTGEPMTIPGRELLAAYPVGARVEIEIAPDPWTPAGVDGVGTVAGVLEDVHETGDAESGPSVHVWVALGVWHEGTLYGLHPEDGDSRMRLVDEVSS